MVIFSVIFNKFSPHFLLLDADANVCQRERIFRVTNKRLQIVKQQYTQKTYTSIIRELPNVADYFAIFIPVGQQAHLVTLGNWLITVKLYHKYECKW